MRKKLRDVQDKVDQMDAGDEALVQRLNAIDSFVEKSKRNFAETVRILKASIDDARQRHDDDLDAIMPEIGAIRVELTGQDEKKAKRQDTVAKLATVPLAAAQVAG